MSDIPAQETGKSLCPVCLKRIPARYARIDGRAKHAEDLPALSMGTSACCSVGTWTCTSVSRSVRASTHQRGGGEKLPSRAAAPTTAGSGDEHCSGT